LDSDRLQHLVRELIANSTESEWFEFKENNDDSDLIGKNISALSNSAAIQGKPCAYIVWGVNDKTHSITGSRFRPNQHKIGNQPFEMWLQKSLNPRLEVRFTEGVMEGRTVILCEIPPASHTPVKFKGIGYVRVGSCTTVLANHPEKERLLWRTFDKTPFELGIAKTDAGSDEVLSLIDYQSYFRLMNKQLPGPRNTVLERLCNEEVIAQRTPGSYDITNVGAILFARDLGKFDRLSRKGLRVVIYKENDRFETVNEQVGIRGYAVGFQGAVEWINTQLPQNEFIEQALRRKERLYPELAVRELVANSLIHQDFNISGTGPMVEIFQGRIEITNPGCPLIKPLRFIDEPPRSRNEKLAALMRRMAICEERGSGIDKVIRQVEIFQLPPPLFRDTGKNTIAVLYGPRKIEAMDNRERVRACYQHACLQYVSGSRMTNATLRKRLGIPDRSYPIVSKIIRDTIQEDLIRLQSGTRKDANYVPFWA